MHVEKALYSMSSDVLLRDIVYAAYELREFCLD